MASKSVLELAVGTGQWDAGLKKAKQALDNFTQANGGLQSALNKDSQSMQTFVQMMGRMDSTAKTAKGQMNDYKGTIEQLTMQYNRMTDAQKKTIGQDYLHAIDQMKQKYQGVADEVAKINQSLKSMPEPAAMSGGGLFGSGKLDGMFQVFGGNVMTKIAGAGMGFVTEMGDMVKQGIELARAGEGIRIAFERLGRGDILQGLREATHGTVTDMELMKAAVKFNDFKLPLDELGTMLAFAQQKAKDTGQSVDYMVDSIVTGLGRKSLMILDNLGLSATEIRERMKETGDMTKAVGAIIRDQMAKAGDYVETAADRALQANVSLQNKMEELGRKFGPLQEASDTFWTSVKIKILDVVGGPLAQFLNGLTEAGRLQNALNNAKNSARVTGDIEKLKGSNFKQQAYTAMLNRYSREEQAARNNWLKSQKGGMGSQAIWENRYNEARALREEFQRRGNAVLNPTPASSNKPVPVVITPTGGGSGGSNNEPDISKITFDPNKAALGAIKANDGGLSDAFAAYKESMKEQTSMVEDLTEAFKKLNKAEGVEPSENKKKRSKRGNNPYMQYNEDGTTTTSLNVVMGGIANGMNQMVSGIESLGVEIPEGIKGAISAIQGVSTILTGIATTVLAIEAISTANLFKLFSNGGVVHAANGFVDGTTYSGDQIPAMLNAGEVVLNRSQQGVLAASLQAVGQSGEGGGDGKPYVSGEMIWLGLTNYLNRSGRGEIVTSRRK